MNDIRFAFRQLIRARGFSVIAILTLSLGIGLNTSMFSLMNELILKPLPFPQKDQLVRVDRTTPQEPTAMHNAADALELQREAADFLKLGIYRQWGYSLEEPGRGAVSLSGLRTSAEFFSIIGMKPFLGRTFTPEETRPGNHVIMLSHDLWLAQFGGDPNVINRVIQVDGLSTTVIGVMPKEFSLLFLWGPSDVFAPLALTEEEKANRGENGFLLVGRFDEGLTLDQVNSRLATLAVRLAETRTRAHSEDGLRAVTLQSVMRDPETAALSWTMLGLAGIVLMIVCSNLSNLQLARGAARRREFAIRAALGASRIYLLRPLLVESVLLALAGGSLGILVAVWANDWITYRFLANMPMEIPFSLEFDWRVFGFTAAVSCVAGILFGIVPAWLASRVRVNDDLKSGGTTGATGDRSQSRFRQTMIVFQISAALVQLTCAALFVEGLDTLSQRDPRWETSKVTQAVLGPPQGRYSTAEQTYGYYAEVRERLGSIPGVENVSVGWSNPMYQFLTSRHFVVEGREPPPPGREPLAFVNGVTPTFIDTLGMKLAAGRNFSELDGLGAPLVAMINQSMADALFPDEDPVGRRLSLPETESTDTIEIVGVFSDVDLAGNPTPQTTPFQVFIPLAQECWNYVTVSVRSSQPAAMVEPMRQTLAAIDSNVPVQMLSTADDLAAMPMRVMQLFTTILGAFGALGLFLAALGLYGVIAYLIVQRTREIGVRLALGAQMRDMLWLVLGSGLRLAVIGTAIGFGLSVLAAFVLRAVFGTGTEQLGLGGVLAATALVLAVALLASYLPARRAMKVSPLEALRTD